MRDPLHATLDDDDASDQISDGSSNDGHTEEAPEESTSSVGRPAAKTNDPQLNPFETRLGLVPTSTPDFVQHVTAVKARIDVVHEAVKKSPGCKSCGCWCCTACRCKLRHQTGRR